MTFNKLNIESLIQEGHEAQVQLRLDNPDANRELLENYSFRQDIEERKRFANRAFGITLTWIIFLIMLTIVQFFLKKYGFGLTALEFNVVFSTTTGSVLVFWYLVGKYLFNPRK